LGRTHVVANRAGTKRIGMAGACRARNARAIMLLRAGVARARAVCSTTIDLRSRRQTMARNKSCVLPLKQYQRQFHRQMRGNAATRIETASSVTFMTQMILKQTRCWKRRAKAIESGTMNITNLQLAKCRFGMQFALLE
ncbi:MAG: hypothetical protein ABI391_07975, partial [Hyphomicrobiaceae bacterium]